LIKVENDIFGPEVRGVIGKAIATLHQVGQVPAESNGSDLPALALSDAKQIASSLVNNYKKLGGTVSSTTVEVIYTSSLVKSLIIAKNFEVPEWGKILLTLLSSHHLLRHLQ
jgi:elongation factor 3